MLSNFGNCLFPVLLSQRSLADFKTGFNEVVDDPMFTILIEKFELGDGLMRIVGQRRAGLRINYLLYHAQSER